MNEPSVLTGLTELVERAAERRAEHGNRIAEYQRFEAAIFGPSPGGGGTQVIGSYADGRPSLRLAPEVTQSWANRESINLLPAMIKSFQSLRGMMPTLKVLPETGDEEGRKQATLRTRALGEQWTHSKMKKQLKRAAFFLVGLGDACFTLDPYLKVDQKRDHDPGRPLGVYINLVDPNNAFPAFRFGDAGDELDDLYCIWHLQPDDIKRAYDVEVSESCDVIHYYSRTEKQVVIADAIPHRVNGVVHDLGFCPAQWITNHETDGRFAQADIREALGLHDQLKTVFNLYLDSLMWSTWPIIHVRNASQVSSPEIGPGAVIETVEQGLVEMIAPAGQPQHALQMIGAITESLHQVTGVSPIQTQGLIDRSNVSARSVDRQQGPMEQRIVLQNDLTGDGLEAMNSKILLMLSELPGLKGEQLPMYGQDKSGVFNDSFSGSDIGGWVRNKVQWDALLSSSRHERLAMALQLRKESQGIFPLTKVLEAYGDDDPDNTIELGLSEMQMLTQAQQQQQAAMQPPQPGQSPGAPGQAGTPPPGPAAQGMGDAAALQQGGLAAAQNGGPGASSGPMQPAPPNGSISPPGGGGAGLPGFAPVASAPSQPGTGSPAPLPDVSGMIQSALSGLRLYGSVQLAFNDKGPVVQVSDHRDVAQVKQALQPLAAQIGAIPVKIVSAKEQ